MGAAVHETPVTVKVVEVTPTTDKFVALMVAPNVPPMTPLIVTPVVVEPMAKP